MPGIETVAKTEGLMMGLVRTMKGQMKRVARTTLIVLKLSIPIRAPQWQNVTLGPKR